MATLQQTLRGLPQADDQISRGPGGVLRQKKTLQQATQQAGLAAAPTTPMAAQMAGADQQAAKMAGTPQQLGAALKAAGEPAPDLQTTLRRKEYTRQLGEAETAAIQKSEDMQKLGGLGDRVTSMVQAEFKKPTTTDVALSSDLDIIRKDPKSQEAMDAMLRIAQSGQNLDDVAKLIPEAATAIADVAKTAIRDPKDIKLPEFLPELGYTAESLSALLGVTPEEVQGYSVEDLQNKINQVTSEEFTKSQQLQQQAVSPLAGAAERGLAREAGRELSAVGVRATEADMQRLSDEISRADQVSFMGETRSYTDWLADDEVSAIIKDIVESPADSQIRKDLKDNPQTRDLYSFIERNEAALKEAASKLDTSTSEFKGIQTANKKVINDSLGGIALDPKVQEALIPGSTGFSSKIIKPESNPILSHLQDKTPDQRKQFTQQVATISSINPSVASEISKLTPEELSSLDITNNGKNWRNYKSTLEANKAVNSLDPSETTSILSNYSTSISSTDQVNADIETNNTMSNLGFPDSSYNTGSLPIINGKVDTTSLKDNFLQKNPVPKISDAAQGKVTSASFSYRPPTLPNQDTPQGRVLTHWQDFGKLNKVPTDVEMQSRLDKILSDTGKFSFGPPVFGNIASQELLDKKYEADATNWLEKSNIINDLKASGTWAKWGLTDADVSRINPLPTRLEAAKFDFNIGVGNQGYGGYGI